MARNEEKQLARLNRLYLKRQHEEELKKRPPRPKLEMLTSADDVKKWLPSIMRDIDFYVKQMEVPCYPKSKIEEFETRIDHLRGEYKAFLRKLYQLEPDMKTTPWSDRPYMGKHKIVVDYQSYYKPESDSRTLEVQQEDNTVSEINNTSFKNFVPVPTPVLKNDSFYQNCFGFEKSKVPYLNEVDIPSQNEPLQFDFEKTHMTCIQRESSAVPVYCKKLKFNPKFSGINDYYGDHEKLNWSCSAEHRISCVDRGMSVNNKTYRPFLEGKLISENMSYRCCTDTITENQGCSNKLSEDIKNQSGGSIINKEPKGGEEGNGFQNTSEKILKVSVFGALNIPYTDSSSSDEDT